MQQVPPAQVPPGHGVPEGAAAELHAPALQLSVVQGRPSSQAAQAAPPLPHAAVVVPG